MSFVVDFRVVLTKDTLVSYPQGTCESDIVQEESLQIKSGRDEVSISISLQEKEKDRVLIFFFNAVKKTVKI